jgi:hypothetical protein
VAAASSATIQSVHCARSRSTAAVDSRRARSSGVQLREVGLDLLPLRLQGLQPGDQWLQLAASRDGRGDVRLLLADLRDASQ